MVARTSHIYPLIDAPVSHDLVNATTIVRLNEMEVCCGNNMSSQLQPECVTASAKPINALNALVGRYNYYLCMNA